MLIAPLSFTPKIFLGLRREALMRCACRYRGMSLNLKTHHINRALIWWTERLSGPRKSGSTSSSYLPSIRGFLTDKTVLPEVLPVLAFLARKALKLSKSLRNVMHTVWDFLALKLPMRCNRVSVRDCALLTGYRLTLCATIIAAHTTLSVRLREKIRWLFFPTGDGLQAGGVL